MDPSHVAAICKAIESQSTFDGLEELRGELAELTRAAFNVDRTMKERLDTFQQKMENHTLAILATAIFIDVETTLQNEKAGMNAKPEVRRALRLDQIREAVTTSLVVAHLALGDFREQLKGVDADDLT